MSESVQDERFTESVLRVKLTRTAEDIDDLGDGDDYRPVVDGLWILLQERIRQRLPASTQWDPATGRITGYTDLDVLREIVFTDALNSITDDPEHYARVASHALGRPIRVTWSAPSDPSRWVVLHGVPLFYPRDERAALGREPDSQAVPQRPADGDAGARRYTHHALFADRAAAALGAYRLAAYFDCRIVTDEPDGDGHVQVRASRLLRDGTLRYAEQEVDDVVRAVGGRFAGSAAGQH